MLFRSRKLPYLVFLTALVVIFGFSYTQQRENLDDVPDKLREWFHQGQQTAGGYGQPGGPVAPAGDAQKSIIDMNIQPKHQQTGEHPEYLEIFSTTTMDKKYFNIKFASQEAMNPNIIPHPFLNDTWLLVAQKQRSKIPNSIWFAQSVCNANFTQDGTLLCLEEPTILPIASTHTDKCEGERYYFALNVGPHDGRMFYGPEHPYFMFGSNSKYNCFGLWMQDLRMLVDWGYPVFADEYFRLATDLQRPGKPGPVEKNWFVFWDEKDKMYGHYDSTPRRVFAEMRKDGTPGKDLGAVTAKHDQRCLEKYMPKFEKPDLESIHQATNSLSITLCKRADPNCKPGPENTFIMALIQHKTFYDLHSEYEPYVYLFQQSAPFKMYGVTPKPLWIHGRERTMTDIGTRKHSQMFYIVSMSWKNHGQKYHGFIDDTLFLSFGIEDDRPAAIDIVAGDMLQGLGLCEGY